MTRPSPFKGLASFEDSDADASLFFGREREREIIVANLLASRLTVLYGETGVGKSSVLRAGVARDLRALPEPLALVVFDEWQDDPAGALEALVADATGAERQGRLADTLELGSALVGGEVFVILDAFEEEFLYHGLDAGPDSFFDQFSEAVTRPGLRVPFLLAVREDALAKLDRFKSRVPNVFGNYLRLDHLDRGAAREAILGPIDRSNESSPDGAIEIEPALVEAVLDQVAAGKVELGRSGRGGVDESSPPGGIEAPYLQLVMERLWEAETTAGSTVLRLETLERLGGAEQIVRDHLDRALGALEPAQRDIAAAVFNFLVTPSGAKIAHDASDLAGYVGVPPPEVAPVLSSLAAQRILRSVPGVRGSDLPRYEIYHDILADPVLAWRSRHESEREVDRVREAAAKRHRRLLIVSVAAILLAGAMAGVTIFALTQRSEADAQARKARARALDASALTQLSIDPELSLLLAVEGAKRDRGGQAEDVLRRALLASRERGVFRAGKAVTFVRYSPDGSRIVAAGLDGVGRVYDARTRRLLVAFRQGAPITSGDLGSDGDTVVTGDVTGRIALWSPRTGRTVGTYSCGAPVRSVALDAHAARVAAACGRSVDVWRGGTGTRLWRRRFDWPVTRAVFSPDGRLVAVIGNSRWAWVYDAKGVLFKRFDQGDFVRAVAFSPDGIRLATGGRNKTARVWNLQTGAPGHVFTGHRQDVVDVAFGPSGRTLATASLDGAARTWNVDTGELKGIFTGHAGAVTSVTFSPDGGDLLTTSSDRTARLWKNTDTPDVLAVFSGAQDTVTDAAFSPDGTRVVTASADGTARVWDATEPTLDVLARFKGPLVGAAYAGPRDIAVAGPGRTVRLLDGSGGKVLGSFRFPGDVTAAAVSGDGRRLAVAFGRRVSFVLLGRNVVEPAISQPSVVTSVAFSPDGSEVATGGTDGIGRLWTAGGRLLRELKRHRRALTGVAFSPDGRRIATSSRDRTAKIWDIRSGRLLRTLSGDTGAVTSVAYGPDGRLVVTGSTDRDARLWDSSSGGRSETLRWHFGTVRDAQFSPDGRWIVTAGPTTAQLWQPGIPQPLFQFGIGGPASTLTSVVFDHTSRVILAASEDGTVRTFDCKLCGGLPELLRLAHARLSLTGRTLTAAERRQYGG